MTKRSCVCVISKASTTVLFLKRQHRYDSRDALVGINTLDLGGGLQMIWTIEIT